jgi:hypothetical protein
VRKEASFSPRTLGGRGLNDVEAATLLIIAKEERDPQAATENT